MNGSVAVAVLDASALIAFLYDEPGTHRVEAVLGRGALMSMVNWAEVVADMAARGETVEVSAPRARRVIEKVGTLELVPFDEGHAHESARLRMPTKSLGLSLGDRACLSLGRIRRLPVLTTDGAWRSLRLSIKVVLIR